MSNIPTLDSDISSDVTELQKWASSLVVSTNDQKTTVMRMIENIKEKRSQVVAFFEDSKSKAHATWMAIRKNEKSFLDVLDAAKTEADGAVLSFNRQEKQKRIAEQNRLQAIADEKARRDQERQIKKAENLKTPELREQRIEEAETITAPTIAVAPTEKYKGESTRRTWKARLVDMDMLISTATPSSVGRSLLEFNEQAANSFARSTQGNVTVPGVEFYEEETLSIRTGG